MMVVNRPPKNGTCAVYPLSGKAASTPFKVRLVDEFVEEDLPMKYEVSYKCGAQAKASPLFSGK